jgi:hypothetical protein
MDSLPEGNCPVAGSNNSKVYVGNWKLKLARDFETPLSFMEILRRAKRKACSKVAPR